MRTRMIVSSLHLNGAGELRQRWGWFVGLGLLLVGLGTLALMSAMVFTIASVLFFGCLLIAGGVAQAIHALIGRGWGGYFVDLLVGLFNVLIGLMIVSNPEGAAAAITLLIAVFLIVGGVFRIGISLVIPFQHLFWLTLHGIVNVLLGILILRQWPLSGLWVIGLFIGIDMIFNGWSLIMLGLAAKQMPVHHSSDS